MKFKHLLTVCLSAVMALAVAAPSHAGEVPDISHEELTKAIAAKTVVLLDVNGTESYKAGHIPGALDFKVVKADLASKLPADKGALVVAYCGSEQCGAYMKGVQAAKKLGYTNVKHYSPGLAGWKKSGADLAKG